MDKTGVVHVKLAADAYRAYLDAMGADGRVVKVDAARREWTGACSAVVRGVAVAVREAVDRLVTEGIVESADRPHAVAGVNACLETALKRLSTETFGPAESEIATQEVVGAG